MGCSDDDVIEWGCAVFRVKECDAIIAERQSRHLAGVRLASYCSNNSMLVFRFIRADMQSASCSPEISLK